MATVTVEKKERMKITRFNLTDSNVPEVTKKYIKENSICWAEVKGENARQKLDECLPKMPRRTKCAQNTLLEKILKRTRPCRLIVGDPRKSIEISNLFEVCKVVRVQKSGHIVIQISEHIKIYSWVDYVDEKCSYIEIAR